MLYVKTIAIARLVLLGSVAAALMPSAHGQSIPLRSERLPVFEGNATVRSPIEAQVNWTELGGVNGYDVLRNGAVIAELGTSAYSYIDATLRPNTTYIYQVRTRATSPPGPNPLQDVAKFGIARDSQTPSRLTAAVQIITPRALAPAAVTAKAVSAGVAQISWTPRPEALNYLITRNNQQIRVTVTPTAGFYDDRNLPAGAYTYVVQSLMRARDGADVLGEPSRPLTLLVRPFNVVAIGDSVMWGQGLADNSKFVTKVRQWLQGQLGKDVRLVSFARSGALVGPFLNSEENRFAQDLSTSSGEIPRDMPSIMHQALVLAPGPATTPADVDLVLMDGCINDVTVGYILNPNNSEAEIGARTQRLCGPETMDDRLKQIHARFQNAKILVTSYFPIVSDYSDTTAVAVLMINVGALSAAVAPLVGVPIDPITGAIAGLVTSKVLRDKAVSHSAVFHAVSTSALLSSALNSNQRLGGNRIRFVGIPFTAMNAYAAPDTWLWLVPTPGVPISNSKDEVFDQRLRACTTVPNMPATCIPASMGHPNVKGAQAYADAITAALAEFVNAWKVVHAPVQTAGM